MKSLSWLRNALNGVPTRVRIVTLGMLTWALCAFLPWLYHHEAIPALDVAALSLGPVLLVLGTVHTRLPKSAEPFVLLAAFPISLSLGMSRIDHDQALTIFSPSTMLLALFSFAAFGATALEGFHDTEALRAVEHKPLGEVAQVAPSTRRRQAAVALLGILTLGALVALTYGSSATPAHYRERWGNAADAGAVVAALGGGILGCATLAILAPALRAERGDLRDDPNQGKRLRWLFLVAGSGLVVYGLLR